MLDGIEGVMNLAAASGEDLATTSDIVTDALVVTAVSNVFNNVFSNMAVEGIVYTAGVLEADDFLGNIRYNGVVLEE